MASVAVDTDEAFAMLKRCSQNTNVKLRDLAQRLLDTFEVMRLAGADARKAVDEVLGDIAAR